MNSAQTIRTKKKTAFESGHGNGLLSSPLSSQSPARFEIANAVSFWMFEGDAA
jgi:hypothetical protein